MQELFCIFSIYFLYCPSMKETPRKERLSLALDATWKKRAETCATKTKLNMHLIAQCAVEAAVEAIEGAEYRVVMPIEFVVAYVPIAAGKRIMRITKNSR